MAGLAPAHIRMLCESGWEGGGGYTPSQVGDMTLDQIFMRLADKRKLRKTVWPARSVATSPEAAVALSDKDGDIRGRAGDGTPIRGRIGGKSKAAMLREAEEVKG